MPAQWIGNSVRRRLRREGNLAPREVHPFQNRPLNRTDVFFVQDRDFEGQPVRFITGFHRMPKP